MSLSGYKPNHEPEPSDDQLDIIAEQLSGLGFVSIAGALYNVRRQTAQAIHDLCPNQACRAEVRRLYKLPPPRKV